MKIFFRKNWKYIILIAIVAFAFSIRAYHFSDWLHFEMDQARDAELVVKALDEGPGTLPLLGPRAAGTFLRLGPVFYYFQYLAAKIFHSADPAVLAYPDFLFSILAVGLFYFFLRLYFSRFSSLAGTAMFAANFIAIQYSRFAWNPNSIPFWTLVSFYGLIRTLGENKRNRQYWWIAMAIAGWGVASQLHFITFLGIPVIFAIYFLWAKGWKKIHWRGCALAAALILVFLAPMILSDLKTSGDNVKQFTWALRNKPNEHSLATNLKVGTKTQINYYTTLLTSYSSKTGVVSLVFGIGLILAATARIIFLFRGERDEKRKNFLKLIIVWGIISFLILIPFAFNIKSRYMLFAIFLPFMLAVFLIEWLVQSEKYEFVKKGAALIVVSAVVILNAEATFAWYGGLSRGIDLQPFANRRLDIKQTDGITLGQLKAVADHIYSEWQKNPRKIYLHAKMQYRAPVAFLLESRDKRINVSFISFKDDDREAVYFALTTAKNGWVSVPPHYRAKFDVLAESRFERLMVFDLALKDVQPTIEEKERLLKEKEAAKEPPSQTEQNAKKGLRRQERVLWENIF